MRFTGRLVEANDSGGRFVACPFDGKAEFGAARALVAGTVNGTPFRTRLMVYGGTTYLGFTAAIRAAAGVEQGDELDIELELDTQPREVDVPAELAQALAGDGSAQTVYDGLAFTHRREYAEWVGGAKQAATRERRAAKAVQMLNEGTRHP